MIVTETANEQETTPPGGEAHVDPRGKAGCLRYFFSYVPSEPIPEVPEKEPPDPNEGRSLADSYRLARRNLVVVSAICLAWSTAQFNLANLTFDVGGATVDLKDASVPLLLAVSLLYLAVRYGVEYAMMSRHIRRWPIAQLDFRIVSGVARFSVLALAAGALRRSLWSVLAVAGALAALAMLFILLTVVLMFVTTPIRMWARDRANRPSAANAAGEAMIWAGVFAAILTVILIVSFAVGTYTYDPLRSRLWSAPPNPVAFAIFVATLVATFLSHWLLRPITRALFAARPGYFTERQPNGNLRVTLVKREKEPLL